LSQEVGLGTLRVLCNQRWDCASQQAVQIEQSAAAILSLLQSGKRRRINRKKKEKHILKEKQ